MGKDTVVIDDALRARLAAEAELARARAFAPYSNHQVGAAGISADGQIVVGCNVENAAYLALHAEWNLVGAATVAGLALVAMVCVVGQEETSTIAPPCGICRQVLYEHAGSGLAVGLADGWTSLAELLPLAFALEH